MAQVLNQIFSNKIIATLGYTSFLDYYLRQHRTEKSVQKMPFSGKIGVWINK
jgi:hypothetical protein